MTSPKMDFITLVAWQPQASKSELQENITTHFSCTSQDLDSVTWKYGGCGKGKCIVRKMSLSSTSFCGVITRSKAKNYLKRKASFCDVVFNWNLNGRVNRTMYLCSYMCEEWATLNHSLLTSHNRT